MKSGLGKGLGSLIPQGFDTSLLVEPNERIQHLSVTIIRPNVEQPRTVFDDAALKELAESIRQFGIVQPLVVTPDQDGYSIIAGERRWRAAQIAGLTDVPVIVRTVKELEKLQLALIENMQRVDLSPLEQAVSIERLHQQFSVSYQDISTQLGKAVSTVNNIVRLLQLPEAARNALAASQITEGHARQILALKDTPKIQHELLNLIIKHGWSVRQAEQYVSSIKAGFQKKTEAKARVQNETPETKQLSKQFGVPVHLRRTAKGGKLELVFKNDEELALLYQKLQG